MEIGLESSSANEGDILLVYDQECPICDAYCQLVRVRDDAGDLKIVNARDPGEVIDEISAQGLDIDRGMVVKMNGQLYYGADAMYRLALVSSRSGVFNRINFHLFKSSRLTSILYPIFRTLRNLLLKILRKSKINNLNPGVNDKF